MEDILRKNHRTPSLAEPVRKGDIFESNGFYETFQHDSAKTEKLIRKWYRRFAPELLQIFVVLPRQFNLLLIDPGIATRANEFVQFAKGQLAIDPSISPQNMRALFSKSLGTERVYRGMLLSPEEVEMIRHEGLGPFALQGSFADSRLESEFDGDKVYDGQLNQVTQGFVGEVQSRLAGRQLGRSMLLSTSKWIEATSIAAWSSKGIALDPDRTFYLFEIEVPKIRLLKLSGIFNSMTAGFGSWKYFETNRTGTNENFRVSVTDPDFEIFIYGAVPPSSLKAIHAYANRPQPWHPAN